MRKIKYDMKPTTEKREKRKRYSSIYDPMIDAFIKSGHDLVEMKVEDKKPSYVVTQLKKRLNTRELDFIASHGGGFVYLEKKQE